VSTSCPKRPWKPSPTKTFHSPYETQKIEGHWRHGGILYRDDLVRVVVDVPDSTRNRQWMKQFKDRWKVRLEQLELWVVSYRIEVE
jgi:hypothetical protein